MTDQLKLGGQRLWDDVTKQHSSLTPAQLATLLEACRAKDRADGIAKQLERSPDSRPLLSLANRTSDTFKQLLAAVRLPDPRTGRPMSSLNAPRLRETPVAKPNSSLERARLRAESR